MKFSFLLAKLPVGLLLLYNPFTAPACNISGLKNACVHNCIQYILWAYNRSAVNTVHFDENPFTSQ